MEQTVFSVSEINREVKMFLEGTRTFKNIFIEGSFPILRIIGLGICILR